MICSRCGRTEKVQNHHIIAKADGGTDDPENKEPLCLACHDYEHAKRNILEAIEIEARLKQEKRVSFLRRRLEVLESLNTPELIWKRGTYQTWWIETSLHKLPRRDGTIKLETKTGSQLKLEC